MLNGDYAFPDADNSNEGAVSYQNKPQNNMYKTKGSIYIANLYKVFLLPATKYSF